MRVLNPANRPIFCNVLGREIEAGQKLAVTDEEAEALSHSSVFQILDRPPVRKSTRGDKEVETR
jgi:hypothetical protein